MNQPAIMWFRQDLRLSDNPALHFASLSQRPLIFLYIFDDTKRPWALGGASRWWLHQSLKALDGSLKSYGAKLILKKGDPCSILKELVKNERVEQIYFNRCYEPYQLKLDQKIEKEWPEVYSFNSALLREPWEYHTQSGQPFKVFTPFWKACQKLPVRDLFLKPTELCAYKKVSGLKLSELKLLPSIKWYKTIEKEWVAGEEEAHKKLEAFLPKIKDYQELRNRPDLDYTSHLSPHLHFGEISPVEIWQRLHKNKDGLFFLSELAWREFSYHLLYYFPDLPDLAFKEKFNQFPWVRRNFLKKWQQGQTGYPIVDAGMLELWHTGYMHNRVRMITASFLVKNLLVPWQKGEAWFFDTLVDADLANNSASWQWVFGSGADAAPYFRIFNPVLQGQKFDPEGRYVKKWLPALAHLPKKYLHCPWDAPQEVLSKARLTLGQDYPLPLVDLGESRQEALLAFKRLK